MGNSCIHDREAKAKRGQEKVDMSILLKETGRLLCEEEEERA